MLNTILIKRRVMREVREGLRGVERGGGAREYFINIKKFIEICRFLRYFDGSRGGGDERGR